MTSTLTDTTPDTRMRSFYRVVDSGDLDALAVLFAQDASYTRPGYPVLAGRDAIDHFYRHDRVIASGTHTLDSVVVSGNEVAVRGSFSGTLRDGNSVAHRFAEFFVLSDNGDIVARETFFAVSHV